MYEVTEDHLMRCVDDLRISYLEPEIFSVSPRVITALSKNYYARVEIPANTTINYVSTYCGIKMFVDNFLKPNQFNVLAKQRHGGVVMEYYQILDDGTIKTFLSNEARASFRNSKSRMRNSKSRMIRIEGDET